MKALHLKTKLIGASVAAVLLSSTSCNLIWPDPALPPDERKSNITMMTNSSDPQLLSAISKEGYVVDVFGSRDGQGLAESVDQIVVGDGEDKNIYWLDDKRRPIQVITDNGTVFLLEWLTDAKIALTVNSNDGESQINTEIDLSNGGQINGKLNNGNVDINRNVRKGKKLALTSKSISQNLNHTPSIRNKSHNTGTTVDLHVTKCNIPSDAKVWINAHTAYPESKYLTTIFPTRISTGMYTASIPYGTAPSVNPAELCKSIESILGGICQTQIGTPILGDAICMAISAVIAATPLSPCTTEEFRSAKPEFNSLV